MNNTPNSANAASPSISVITVAREAVDLLPRTLDSVACQSHPHKEHIIIDAASKDGTADFLRERDAPHVRWISEPDRSIYDAMNKGVHLAGGQWLIFLNAGDVFLSPDTMALAASQLGNDIDALYSDGLHEVPGRIKPRILPSDHTRMHIHHQSLFYRASLHEEYGPYLDAPGVTIADYIFFNQMRSIRWKKTNTHIAIGPAGGVSSKPETLYFRLAVDMLFKNRSFHSTALIILLYPAYRLAKKTLRALRIIT